MKYFSQTGDYSIINQTNLTSQQPQDNSVKIIRIPVIFSNKKININDNHDIKEEFTEKQEKTFYKKVFKTSLA